MYDLFSVVPGNLRLPWAYGSKAGPSETEERHSGCADPNRDLHYHISKLIEPMPPILNLIDGIYSLEGGPAFDGRVKRTNLLIASADIISADFVGAKSIFQTLRWWVNQ